ncbi:hypothetical protein PIB30_000537 [Stylosanthes scabra]|uniref:Uncharacterized protein n=1 Tax=Stylosanthes scabra TaxID=79078 RepID=A0ABU6W2U7_9FABA|nr:hypothetical protein [Stylosanthes scabra]
MSGNFVLHAMKLGRLIQPALLSLKFLRHVIILGLSLIWMILIQGIMTTTPWPMILIRGMIIYTAYSKEKKSETVTQKSVEGTQIIEKLTSLVAGRQVVLSLNRRYQAVGEMGGMLITMLGIMVIDFAAFPIHRYFHFEVENKEAVKDMILAKLGKIWKDTRGRLFHKFYDETKSLDENVQHRCPRGINSDH